MLNDSKLIDIFHESFSSLTCGVLCFKLLKSRSINQINNLIISIKLLIGLLYGLDKININSEPDEYLSS